MRYAWLRDAVGRRCVVSPEFPTGNGKVDLVLQTKTQMGVIEVKSFVDMYELKQSRLQAARYAQQLRLSQIALAVFVPPVDDDVLNQLSSVVKIKNVRVTTVAISWG